MKMRRTIELEMSTNELVELILSNVTDMDNKPFDSVYFKLETVYDKNDHLDMGRVELTGATLKSTREEKA